MIIEGPCDSKTFMVFAICLNETKNESVKKTKNQTGDVRDDCDGNAVGTKGCAHEPERACEAAGGCSTTTQTDVFYPLYSLSYSA